MKSESLLSKTDLTVQSLVSHESSFIGDSEECKNSSLTPVRGRALSDLLSTSTDSHSSNLPVLEPIKIQSTEIAEGESSESEPEDKVNFEAAYDSDDDSEPEADRQISKTEDKGDGK